MTKFEALKAIVHCAGMTVADVASNPDDKINSMLIDSALEKIALSTKEFAPKRSPLELPLGVKLTRFSGQQEIVLVGTRLMHDVKGNEVKKLCRVIVDMDLKRAFVYYDGKFIGSADSALRSRHFLVRSGIGVLRAYLAVLAHNKDNRDRKAAAKKEGK